jgi:hypothetical protein
MTHRGFHGASQSQQCDMLPQRHATSIPTRCECIYDSSSTYCRAPSRSDLDDPRVETAAAAWQVVRGDVCNYLSRLPADVSLCGNEWWAFAGRLPAHMTWHRTSEYNVVARPSRAVVVSVSNQPLASLLADQ